MVRKLFLAGWCPVRLPGAGPGKRTHAFKGGKYHSIEGDQNGH
jgi:hypothetical protein